jgi:hypothetical protein
MATLSQKLIKLAKEMEKVKPSDVMQTQQQFELPFEIGGEYFIRTVTYHLTGRVKDIVGKFLILEDAAWIADSGRFHKFFTDPTSELEVEPFANDVFVNTDSITDATERKVLVEVK